ncbi:MAG: ABC transporter ATP-binding protein [Acidobacteriota bacterium]
MPLTLHNISKTIDNRAVLRGLSISAEEGEIFGIFGPSSAGKSALINLIAGKLTPDSGTISYKGSDVTTQSCEDRAFHFPAISNESIWRALFRTNRSSELADGEGQVIAFKNALENTSGVLLLDNSFCEMDKLMREAAFREMRRAAASRKLTIIFATNDFEDVMLACDRVGVIVEGQLRQVGVPQEIYESPSDSLVAKVVGRNNFFLARRLTSSKAELPEYQTLVGDHRLFTRKAERGGGLAPLNQNVTLSIRPEHVSISFGASFPEDNIIRATVKRIQFLGPTTLVEFNADGLTLEASVLRVVGLAVGDECMLSLPPDRIQIFKD